MSRCPSRPAHSSRTLFLALEFGSRDVRSARPAPRPAAPRPAPRPRRWGGRGSVVTMLHGAAAACRGEGHSRGHSFFFFFFFCSSPGRSEWEACSAESLAGWPRGGALGHAAEAGKGLAARFRGCHRPNLATCQARLPGLVAGLARLVPHLLDESVARFLADLAAEVRFSARRGIASCRVVRSPS